MKLSPPNDSKTLVYYLFHILEFLWIILLKPIYDPLRNIYAYCVESKALDKSWKYKLWFAAPIGMVIYGFTIFNGLVANYSYIKKFFESQSPEVIKVELVVTNKDEISRFFDLRTEAIKSKNCKEASSFEAKFFYADEDTKTDWLNQCQNNVNQVLAYDFTIYKWDKIDEENRAEILAFEIVDERNGGTVEKVFYERRFYMGRQLESPYLGNWMVLDTTKNKFKKETRVFE
jgi:hypothetical protein